MELPDLQHNILFSCTATQEQGAENLVRENVLSYLIVGKSSTLIGDHTEVRYPGSIALVRRNTLLKTTKYPDPDGRPFQSLSIFLERSIVEKIGAEEHIQATTRYTGDPGLDFTNSALLKGFFDSLVPYFVTDAPLTASMAELKTREVVHLLLRQNSTVRNFLFDFSEPTRIDLEPFMNRNYIYRIPISELARLTGRSMATFKRDFKKIFGDTPERWIQHKRLERAHFLIAQQRRPPAAVYAEVGFESLSHFSIAFKKHFGYNPSTLG